jgi:hypothetical protein
MASSWSIVIDQLPNGGLTFTPDVQGAKVGQPLGVNSNDNVTWNNRTNHEIKLQQLQPPIQPPDPGLFPFESIQAGSVSNPIFNVTETVGYSGSIVAAKPGPSNRRKSPAPPPVNWIVVV